MNPTERLLRLSEARARSGQTVVVARVIDACIEAAKAAMVCSDACRPIAEVFHLERCMHRTRAASDLCWTTAGALLHEDADRATAMALVEACRVACDASARGCAPHAPNHAFCHLSGRACEEAAAACGELLALWAAEETGPRPQAPL
jgi:hypothetical protein